MTNRLHAALTKKHRMSRSDVALQSEKQMPDLTEMEELYWFAVALTGDPEFAARLVVDTGKLTPTGRGIFTDRPSN
jgi:hypothetical protein